MGKKILDFSCSAGHVFEGWFASDEEWRAELAQGRFACPVCGSRQIERKLTAPHFSRVAGTTRTEVARDMSVREGQKRAQMQAKAIKALRRVADAAEDVGGRFPKEVRDMREGKTAMRLVKGQCAPDEARALREEGIPVMPLPDLVIKKLN